MSEPNKHHFLPVFYLKRWAKEGGELVQYSRPYKNIVKPLRRSPEGAGYIEKLYAVEGLDGAWSQEVERNFLSPVDSRAATALQSMLKGTAVTSQERRAWAHFIVTLLLRMPTEIQLLKQFARTMESEFRRWVEVLMHENLPEKFHPILEEGLQKLKDSAISLQVAQISAAMSGDDLLDRLVSMEWRIIHATGSPNEFLTSDRPVIVERNIQTLGDTVIAFPVGPQELFVASTAPALFSKLDKLSSRALTENINIEVVSGANQYVYGSSDRQLRFVQNRLGKNKNPSLIAEILNNANLNIEKIISSLPRFDDPETRMEFSDAISRLHMQTESGELDN